MSGAGNGCAMLVLTILLLACLSFLGVAAVIDSAANWRHVGAIVQVAEQETEQTRIEWDARTEIARIQADATKKTSFAFVAFYIVRYGVWVASGLWVVAGLLWVAGRVRR